MEVPLSSPASLVQSGGWQCACPAPEPAWPGLAVQPDMYVPPRSGPATPAATSPLPPTSYRIPLQLFSDGHFAERTECKPHVGRDPRRSLTSPNPCHQPSLGAAQGLLSPLSTDPQPAPSPGPCSSYYTTRFPIRADGGHHGHTLGTHGLEGEKDTWMHPKQGGGGCFHRDSALGWGALGMEIREGFPEQVALGLALEPRVYFS